MKPTVQKKAEGEKKIDGRKARRFDCDWNNDSCVPTGCAECRICKYLDFIDWAESVGHSEDATIQRDDVIEKYIKLQTVQERQSFIREL